MRQDTVNDELDKVEGTRGLAYISLIAYSTTSNGDVFPIGILLLRCDVTYNYGVANFFSFILRDIVKSNDAGGVRAFHSLVLWDFRSFVDSLE